MKKHLVAYFPLGIVFLLFLLDKIFLIKEIQFLTQKDPTFLYYQYKEELIQKLSHSEPKKKNLVVMGSSRFMFFDYQEFKKNFPDWELYNFSVPVNSPAYYLYIVEKILDASSKIDFVVLETDPFQFNEYSPGFRRSNLPYTFDFSFVIRYFSLFERDEVSAFLGYNLFAGKRYPPDIYVLWQRLKNPQEPIYQFLYQVDRFQRENQGCGLPPILNKEWYMRDLAEMEISAYGNILWLYKNYSFSKRQWEFFQRTIELIEKNNITYLLVKPPVSPVMEEMLQQMEQTQKATQIWKEKMQTFLEKSQLMDFSSNTRFFCNTFFDATHMSIECYHFVLEEILKWYQNRLRKSNLPRN
ncbi:MAG: DUF1574 domain-containing protein [Leptospiraceae bacterium]|nr:DUF1574 domain-containing protein [Leptospiraceae bacterium]MDW7976446.1 DUF1574 family protein [Leptospiraceae bacterium]